MVKPWPNKYFCPFITRIMTGPSGSYYGNPSPHGAEIPSQKNMSQTRSTEAQGRVRAKMHINHSVM
jgi:hypothetical protein